MNLRTRLTLSYLAVILLAMALLGFLSLSLLERYFLEAMEQSLVAQAQITAHALIPGATALGPDQQEQVTPDPETLAQERNAPAYNQIQQQLTSNLSLQTQNVLIPGDDGAENEFDLASLGNASLQLSSQLDTRIRLLDPEGNVLVDSLPEENGAPVALLVDKVLAGEYAMNADGEETQDSMHLALPLVRGNQLIGAIYLSQPLDDLTAVVSDLRSRWLLAGLVAALLSAAAGLLLSRAISRPIGRLTVAARAVAGGDYDHQVPVRSRDELSQLSRAFNEMTSRLRIARQTQTDFVANVSHELRTPLTSIKGMVETLRDGAVDDPQVRDRFLETVESETDRLIRLVRDLLTMTRADSKAMELKRKPTGLVELARIAAEQLEPVAAGRELTIEVVAPASLPPVNLDPDQISQVLLNLLDNAIKYSRPGGTITIEISQEGPEALVQVRDQGIGIPADQLPKIGQRFYRADRARSRSDGGSGLGIAIAQALVQAHGGRLWLESQHGAGTTVFFTIPIG